jgi:putative ABC transport system substrate-binding protein
LDRPLAGGKRRATLLAIGAGILAPAAFAADRPRRVGYLTGGAGPEVIAPQLAKRGWVVGKNLEFEVRLDTDGDPAKVRALAAELVRSRVDVLLTFSQKRVSALANATSTIPIVTVLHDPVGDGFARNLRQPGRNITGLSYGAPEHASFAVYLLKIVRPRVRRILMIGPSERLFSFASAAEDAIRAAGIRIDRFGVGSTQDLTKEGHLKGVTAATYLARIEQAFDRIREPELEVALPDRLPDELVEEVAAMAVRRRIATYVDVAAWVRRGFLLCGGIEHADPFRQLAGVLDKVLRGGNPAEIPFELPDRSILVINRRTAEAIGVQLSPEILLRATEVVG